MFRSTFSRQRCDQYGLAAFCLYLVLSILFFGRLLVGDFTGGYIGQSADPSTFMWFLVWWPHAIRNHLNPFFTNVIWAPSGINLAWTTCIPILSLIVTPLTWTVGPVASYNALCLLSPPLAAWTAFLMCRKVTGQWVSSIIGGYIFGFSGYMLGQMALGHLHMMAIFLIPLAVYLFVLRLNAEITVVSFTVILALLLTGEALCSLELFATTTFFGMLAILLAFALLQVETRSSLRSAVIPVAFSYAAATLILSPYLYYLFALDFPHGPIWSLQDLSADLLNFAIPTDCLQLGELTIFRALTNSFRGNIGEAGAYLSLPLIALVIAYTRSNWRKPVGRFLVILLLVICLVTLGPELHVAGRPECSLPWKVCTYLPLLDKALPARFVTYAFLDISLIISLWLSNSRDSTIPIAVALVAVLLMLPNLSERFWTTDANVPSFFSSGLYRHYLSSGETAIVLPYGHRGNTMLWQAQTSMYFRMAGGDVGALPTAFSNLAIVPWLFGGAEVAQPHEELAPFLSSHGVRTIIVAYEAKFWTVTSLNALHRWRRAAITDRQLNRWCSAFSTLGLTPVKVGGVLLYRIPLTTWTNRCGHAKCQPEAARGQTLKSRKTNAVLPRPHTPDASRYVGPALESLRGAYAGLGRPSPSSVDISPAMLLVPRTGIDVASDASNVSAITRPDRR